MKENLVELGEGLVGLGAEWLWAWRESVLTCKLALCVLVWEWEQAGALPFGSLLWLMTLSHGEGPGLPESARAAAGSLHSHSLCL